MRRIGVLVAAALVVALGITVVQQTASAQTKRYCLQVVRVIDGDTFVAKGCRTNREYRIRMQGVRAPEIGEPGGAAATQHLRSLLPRGTRISFQWSRARSYGRYVGITYVRGRNIDRQMDSFVRSSRRSPTTASTRSSSCAHSGRPHPGGGWATVGPFYRGCPGYDARYDGDNDGISCERGCRYWKP